MRGRQRANPGRQGPGAAASHLQLVAGLLASLRETFPTSVPLLSLQRSVRGLHVSSLYNVAFGCRQHREHAVPPGTPGPLSPKAEPGSGAAGPPPWGPCRHLQGQSPERVLHPYLQQQTGCHKHNLFLLVLASCLQWGLILQREVDSLFSECRCVCGSHLTTSPHPSLSSSLHPITSSEYPHISASPQPLCPEHGTLEHPSPTTSAHAGTSPSRLSSRPSPQ